MCEQQRREQGKAAAWCGRLLLLGVLIAGIVTMHTFGHPTAGHGGPATLSARVSGTHTTNLHVAAAHPMEAHPTEAHPTDHSPDHSAADTDGGALDPGTVCRAALSFWVPVLLVLLGAGVLLGNGEAGLAAALRALLLCALRPIPPPPRRKALAWLSVLRV